MYHRIFKLEEIENSRLLQFLFYCITLSFFVTFYGWINSSAVSISSYIAGFNVCPPYFLNCGQYYFLNMLPYGYSQSFFYVCLFLVLGYGVYHAVHSNWEQAHLAILICFIWKCIWAFGLSYGVTGNFDYYDMILAFIWLFLTNKEYFAKLTFVFLYFLASSIKIHEGWILGNYFNSLFTGAPFFPQQYLPVLTNILIIMQMIGCWFLLSKNKVLQQLVFIYFLIFHIYSGIIVSYRYIAISIPALFILFSGHIGDSSNFSLKAISKKTIAGYLLILFLIVCQFTAIFISGDQKKTLEGNYYGMYMFEANHQCISNARVYYKDGTTRDINAENHVSNIRCDPYSYWFKLRNICERAENLEKVSWTFDHSINGHKYERIVDVDNLCSLTYKSFSHNDWIQIDEPKILDNTVYKNGFGQNIDESIQIVATPLENDSFLNIMAKIYWMVWSAIIISFILFLGYITFKQYDK